MNICCIFNVPSGIDQWTKYIAETQLKPIESIPLIRDVFHLTYSTNTGAAFSILRDKAGTFNNCIDNNCFSFNLLFNKNKKNGSNYLEDSPVINYWWGFR